MGRQRGEADAHRHGHGFAEGQRLVILAGTEQRLSYAIQSRLGLEAIYPGQSGVLDAFATANDPGRPTRR